MLTTEKILSFAKNNQEITSAKLAEKFNISRQYASRLIKELVDTKKLVKIGSTRKTYYILAAKLTNNPKLNIPNYKIRYKNKNLEEHKILENIILLPVMRNLPENVTSIFTYAFSEMMNNAIEHSNSKYINIEVGRIKKILYFIVEDNGIGVFRNIMQKRKLNSELEAIQDLLKGKTTTMPRSHSGEGIFFTSKVADIFILDSYGRQLITNNLISDVFVQKIKIKKRGTRVTFQINIDNKKHLNDTFKKFTNTSPNSDYGFDKTQITVKLYTTGGIYVSRSQARRILSELEKFQIIVFDYEQVPMVGQAFADEIYRVWHRRHPKIKLENINMSEGVEFMINRAINSTL